MSEAAAGGGGAPAPAVKPRIFSPPEGSPAAAERALGVQAFLDGVPAADAAALAAISAAPMLGQVPKTKKRKTEGKA